MSYKAFNETQNYRDDRTGEVFSAKRITNASYTYHYTRSKDSRKAWAKFRKENSIEDGSQGMFINPNSKTISYFSRTNEQPIQTQTKTSMRPMNLEMGPVKGTDLKLTVMGTVAVAINGGFSSYDQEAGTLTDVTGFTMDFDGAFYNMPAVEVEQGDLIRTKHGLGYVKKSNEKSVKVMLLDGEVKEIVSTKSPFGFNFYTKIVSIFDMGGGEGSGLFGEMNPMMLMMMSQNGDGGTSNGNPFGGDMMSMMMMSQMFGGGNGENPLASMFGGKSKGKDKS